jgi:hypothetical protein
MKRTVVYNVLVGGFSIGLTFNHNEAVSWLQSSSFQGRKEIIAVRYNVDGDVFRFLNAS